MTRLAMIMCSLVSLLIFDVNAAVVKGSSIKVTYTATYVAPSCNITVPAKVDFKTLPRGTISTVGFGIKIDCTGFSGGYVGISFASAYVSADNKLLTLTDGAFLSLKAGDAKEQVIFNDTTRYCEAAVMSTVENCPISAIVNVASDASAGYFSVPVVATLRYF